MAGLTPAPLLLPPAGTADASGTGCRNTRPKGSCAGGGGGALTWTAGTGLGAAGVSDIPNRSPLEAKALLLLGVGLWEAGVAMKSKALWLAATGCGVLLKLSNASKPLAVCAPFEEENGSLSPPPIKSKPDGATLALGAGTDGAVGAKASNSRSGSLLAAALASSLREARLSELPKGLVLLNGSAPQAPAPTAGLAPPALEKAGLALAVPDVSRTWLGAEIRSVPATGPVALLAGEGAEDERSLEGAAVLGTNGVVALNIPCS
jgi:hypothetical protein